MGKVSSLAKINKHDCEMIDKFMTKYSFYEHSQPLEAPLGRTEIAVGEIGRLDGVAHEHPGFEAFADAVQAHLHLLVAGHEFVPQRIVDLRTAGKSQHSRHAQHQNGVEPLANASIILHRTYYNYRIPPPPAPDTPIPACRCGGHTPPGRHRPLPKRARCRRHSP